jgi:hypothetical protein
MNDYDEANIIERQDSYPLPEFDYSSVPEQWRNELQSDTETLHSIEAQTFALAVQRGLILLRWKERLPHGQFMEWRRWALPGPGGQGYSDQSYSNWMNLATHYPEIPATVNFQLGAAYLLASGDVSEDTRQLAIKLAAGGMRVNKRVAFVLSSAPEWLLKKFVDGKVGAEDAEAVTLTLKRYPYAVSQYAEKWQPSKAAAVDFIGYALNNHNQRKKEDPQADTLLEELIAADGWMQAGGFSEHLSTVTSGSIDAFLSERRREQATNAINKAYFTKRSQAKLHQFTGGFLILDGLDPEFQLPDYVKLGDSVEIEIKIKRGDNGKQ